MQSWGFHIWEGGQVRFIHFSVSACPANLFPTDSHHLSSCWGVLECPGKVATSTGSEEHASSALAESTFVLRFI